MDTAAFGLTRCRGLLATFHGLIGFGSILLADRLEELLGHKVDLVAADGIKENRRPFILSSLVPVAPRADGRKPGVQEALLHCSYRLALPLFELG